MHLPDYQDLTVALECEVILAEALKRSHKIEFVFTLLYCSGLGGAGRGPKKIDPMRTFFFGFEDLEPLWDSFGSKVICAIL